MTAPIRPIFLVMKSETNPKNHRQRVSELIGFDPLRKSDETYKSKDEFNWTHFKTWCKGGSRNSRVVFIVHKATQYRAVLDQEAAKMKDKLPKTWQLFDTTEITEKASLTDLKQQYNITTDNDAKAIHQVFATMTQGFDFQKVCECLFKPDAEKTIQVMIKKPVTPPPLIPSASLLPLAPMEEPVSITECYFHLETINAFDFSERIISISAFIPSRVGTDPFFNSQIPSQAILENSHTLKARFKYLLSHFVTWIESAEEKGRLVLISHQDTIDSVKILKEEATRAKVTFPPHWVLSNLYTLFTERFTDEPKETFYLNRLANRFKIVGRLTPCEITAKIVQQLAPNILLQGIVQAKPSKDCLPNQLPAEDVVMNDIFYFKEQGELIEGFVVNDDQ